MSEGARLRWLFGAYFAYVGIFSPYLSLYLAGQGFAVAQIGLLMAIPNLMRIVAPSFWGWLADRGGRSDHLLRVSAALALVATGALALAADAGLAAVASAIALLAFATGAQGPIGEARTLALVAGDSGGYGRIRLWGSLGFLAAVAATGPALDRLGTPALPALMALALFVLLVVVAGARKLPGEVGAVRGGTSAEPIGPRLAQPHVAAFFAANFLMIFAHAALYVLFSLYLERHGYSGAAIGALWALGVLAEVAVFQWQRGVFARFSAGALLAFSIAVAALRFGWVAVAGGALVAMVVTQLLHGITFGLHHSAVMALLHRWFPSAQQARAQALYLTIAYGLGGSLGGLALGALWDRATPQAAFIAASAAAVLGAMVMGWAVRREKSACCVA